MKKFISSGLLVAIIVLSCYMKQGFASQPATTPSHDKKITQIRISGKEIPERIFILPYTAGPSRSGSVQEATGVTINWINDYAFLHPKERPLVIKLANPIIINKRTHNSELLIAAEPLDPKKGEKYTWQFDEEQIDTLGESNELRIDLGIKAHMQKAALLPLK